MVYFNLLLGYLFVLELLLLLLVLLLQNRPVSFVADHLSNNLCELINGAIGSSGDDWWSGEKYCDEDRFSRDEQVRIEKYYDDNDDDDGDERDDRMLDVLIYLMRK